MKSEVLTVSSLALLYAIRMLGLFMVLPVLFIYGRDYANASPVALGLALGAYGLTQAVFQIPLGLLSDFWGRKTVIVLGLLVFAVGSVVAAMSDSVFGLIIGRALQGSGAIASTIMALVADLTSDKNRTKAMAAIGASIGLSFMVAMVLGPILAAFAGLSGIFIVAALLALVGIVIVTVLVPTPAPSVHSHRDSGAIPSLMWRIFTSGELARLNVGIFVLHAVLTAMFVAVPTMLVSEAGVQESAHWQVYLPVLLVSFITALPIMIIAEKKARGKEAFIAAVAVLVIVFSGLASLPLVTALLPLMFLFFLAFNLLEAMLPSLVSKLAPAGGKGTAMGIYSTAQFLGAFTGGALGGVVIAHFGASSLFAFCGVLSFLWLMVAAFMARPLNLASVCFPVTSDAADLDLVSEKGVADAIYVEEDGMLYLKVDKKKIDFAQLDALLKPYSLP